MQKKLQDVIISRQKKRVPRAASSERAEHVQKTPAQPAASQRNRFRVKRPLFARRPGEEMQKRRPSRLIWVVAVVVVLFLFVAFSTLFEKAILEITPKQTTLTLDNAFEAVLLQDAKENGVPFEIMTVEHTESKEVQATEIKQVERHASGRIVIYNDFNSQSQRLIKNTRFETPEGLIFRIRESVNVPGQKKAGGETIPGSIAVTVYANEPGEKYNIGHRDFTIPGFGGTPRFEHFYARSETEMAGGFSGIVKTISNEERRAARTELEQALKEKLLMDAHSQKPEDSILFEDAIFLTFNSEAPAEEPDVDKETVTVLESATLRGAFFQKDILSRHIAKALLPDLADEDEVIVQNLEELHFVLVDKKSLTSESLAQFTFSIKGNPFIVWQFDEEKLRTSLAGKPKDQLREILAGFPSIVKAEVTLRPFWKRSFSEDAGDIEIRKVLE